MRYILIVYFVFSQNNTHLIKLPAEDEDNDMIILLGGATTQGQLC